jgi:hypothetical protein
MPATVLTESSLRSHVAHWLKKAGSDPRRTLLVRAKPVWNGSPDLAIEDRPVRVIEGVSGLAVLNAERSAGPDQITVALTDLTEAQLGTAVVLDAIGQRVTEPDEWQSVPDLLGMRATIPGPVKRLGNWVPGLLTEWRPERGYPPAPGGAPAPVQVCKALLLGLLGLDTLDALTFTNALPRLDDPGARDRLRDLSQPVLGGLVAAAATVDACYGPALRAAAAPGGVSVVAVGVAVSELWAEGGLAEDSTIAAARVRLEQYLGKAPRDDVAQAYGAAARQIARRMIASRTADVHSILDQAQAVLDDAEWPEGASRSSLLPAGLTHRAHAFAQHIEEAVQTGLPTDAQAVDTALTAIESHDAHVFFERSRPTAVMAVRLVRWLQTPQLGQHGLSGAVLDFADSGAWAERALGDLWNGDDDPRLASAYGTLAHAVRARLRAADLAAAKSLTGDERDVDGVVLVEHVLSQLVEPLTASRPVLLVVLDGMSAPAAIELVDEAQRAGQAFGRDWTELVDRDTQRRSVALAALPSITQFSRTSLFSGELLRGDQQVERSRFAAATSGVVFHKNGLRAEAGHTLPASVDAAIQDPKRRAVGVVLNTIDEALDRADVDALRWTVDSIAHLTALLAAAHRAGRLVVLTSDHGHIIERGSELRDSDGSAARWRNPASGPAAADEVLVRGHRVLAPGGEAVLAVSDGLRYASKKAGYHGGASLAELTIPVIVLKPAGTDEPAGWMEAPPQQPTWWDEPVRVHGAGLARSEAAGTRQAPERAIKARSAAAKRLENQPTLFETEPAASEARSVSLQASVVERLIAGTTYTERKRRLRRLSISDSSLRAILGALVDGGGRAHESTLARAAGAPLHQMAGLLAAMRRLLNVDGYPVLDRDADGVTVTLDVALLREQFNLDGEP